MRRGIYLIVVVAVLVSSFAPAAAAATATTASSPAPFEQVDTSGATCTTPGDLNYEYLASNGQRPGNTEAGMRAAGKYESYQLVHFGSGSWWADRSEDSKDWELLHQGETVKRNQVWLRSGRAWGAEAQNATICVAYWNEASTQITNDANQTVTETVARNVTVDQVTLNVGGGRDMNSIPLRPMFDERKHVTAWVAGQPAVKWTFAHKSSQAAVAMGQFSRGEFVTLASGWFALPILFLSMITLGAVGWVMKKADAGPQYHPMEYGIVAFLVGLVVLFGMWGQFSELVAQAPWIIAVAVSILIGGTAMWLRNRTYKALWLKPTIEFREQENPNPQASDRRAAADAVSDGGQVPVVTGFDTTVRRCTRTQSGEVAIIPRGIFTLIARLRKGSTIVKGAKERTNQITPTSGPFRELYVADPDSDHAIAWRPESIGWGGFNLIEQVKEPLADDEPKVRRELNTGNLLKVAAAVSASVTLGSFYLGGWVSGLLLSPLALAVVGLETRAGVADYDPAPVEIGKPLAAMLLLVDGLSEIKEDEEFAAKWLRERADNSQRQIAFEDSNDLTMMGQAAREFGLSWRDTDFSPESGPSLDEQDARSAARSDPKGESSNDD